MHRSVSVGCLVLGTAALAFAAAADEPSAAATPTAPLTIVDLQPFRTETTVPVQAADGSTGTLTLTNLNPYVNAWLLLTIDFERPRGPEAFHLENADRSGIVTLAGNGPGRVVATFSDGAPPCVLGLNDGPPASSLRGAQRSGLPYAPLCGTRLYLRNPTVGHATTLEKVTSFLRDHVWHGEEIVTFVKKEVYRDAFREHAEATPQTGAQTAPEGAPQPALVDPMQTGLAVVPPHLGLDVDAPTPELVLGRWYGLRGVPDAYFGVMMPQAIAPAILGGREPSVSALTASERTALVYLVAFDLQRFELRFTLGTEHPRLGWSPRTPPDVRDPRLPGPDGIDTPAPLVITGMAPPEDTARTVAAFAGGFKREHGAFRAGTLAERNHGSHYGFIEEGVVFSRLQPGLATVFTTLAGEVSLKTWKTADNERLAGIRDARQNGVPIVEFSPRRNASAPGALVGAWVAGNWSGSVNEELRTVRAGLCLLESPTTRFLIFAYFSSASPSAMARVFQAYRCHYAMHLDMNALEHTYFALYVSQGGRRSVEHLIDGMDVLDRHSGDRFAPRFVGYPDNRDFFYLMRRSIP